MLDTEVVEQETSPSLSAVGSGGEAIRKNIDSSGDVGPDSLTNVSVDEISLCQEEEKRQETSDTRPDSDQSCTQVDERPVPDLVDQSPVASACDSFPVRLETSPAEQVDARKTAIPVQCESLQRPDPQDICDDDNEITNCDNCAKIFTSARALKTHIEGEHTENEKDVSYDETTESISGNLTSYLPI